MTIKIKSVPKRGLFATLIWLVSLLQFTTLWMGPKILTIYFLRQDKLVCVLKDRVIIYIGWW